MSTKLEVGTSKNIQLEQECHTIMYGNPSIDHQLFDIYNSKCFFEWLLTSAFVSYMTIKGKLFQKITQHEIVCRPMFVGLDIGIVETGKGLL